MDRRAFLTQTAAAAAIATAGARRGAAQPASRPNIVFILGDDIGYGDLGCYGATRVQTPHCDRLAAEGLRCRDAHSPAAMCSPTRYGFLTGEYSWRNPATARGVLAGDAPLCIDPTRLTTPRLLQRAGYTTGVVGKWHLGLGTGTPDFNGELKPGPLELGFDESFIFPATGDRVPCVYVDGHRVAHLDPADPLRVSYGAKVGDEPTGKEHPELLRLGLTAGHDGTIINGISRIGFMAGGHAARWQDETIAETFTAKAVDFIDRHHAAPFFLYLPTHDIHVPRVPGPRFRGSSGCGVRGDCLHEFDDTVGQVLAALERHHLTDNTLVIVSSDNGGAVGDGYDDGAERDLHGHQVNGPLRGSKTTLFEGGHRVPLLARWPGHVPAGATSDALLALCDLPMTFASLTGQAVPDDAFPDSFDALPALLAATPALLAATPARPVRDHLVAQSGGGLLALREGTWKAIPKGPLYQQGSLYDLAHDLGETTDLAATEKPRLDAMLRRLRELRGSRRTRPVG